MPNSSLPLDPNDPAVRLALAVADHAAPLFVAGLALTALAALVAWRLLHRVLPAAGPDEPPPPGALLWRMGLGLAVVGAAGLVFAEVAEVLAEPEPLGRFDQALAGRLAQALSPGTLRLFALLTHLGDAWWLTLLCIAVGGALAAVGRGRLALAWLAGCAGGGLLNRFLKSVFERVRPPHEHGFAVADGFSFPSGHSAGAVVVYGLLTWLALQWLPRRWHPAAVAVAASLVFTIGCSRVLLQVHWASDVIAGWASGIAWLLVCVLVLEWRRYRRAPVHTAASANREGTR